MADLGDFLSGAGGGAMAGSTFGPIGTGVGAVLGGISSLFGSSPADQRKQSYDQTRKLIQGLREESNRRRQEQLRTGIQTIGKMGGNLAGASRQGAASRAAGMGRAQDTESFVLPVEQQANASTNKAAGGFVSDTNSRFDNELAGLDNAELQAQFQYNQTPTTPSVGSTLLGAGSAISKVAQTQSYLDSLKESADQNRSATSAFNPYSMKSDLRNFKMPVSPQLHF